MPLSSYLFVFPFMVSGGWALQCYTICVDDLCPMTCAPTENACFAIFNENPGGTIYNDFGCSSLAGCNRTRCETEKSSLGTHDCCCDHDLCNTVHGLEATPYAPPSPPVPPPPPIEGQLSCETYHCSASGCVHDYQAMCLGVCTATYVTDVRNNYVVGELSCDTEQSDTEQRAAPVNCSLDTSGTTPSISCSCSGQYCNSIARLTFSNIHSVVDYVDTECQDVGCDHICVTPRNGDPSRCLCHRGYLLSPTSPTSCLDIDECAGSHDCSHGCYNTEPSYTCTCPDDMFLSEEDMATCIVPPGLRCDKNGTFGEPPHVEACIPEAQAACHVVVERRNNVSRVAVSGCFSRGSEFVSNECILEQVGDPMHFACSCIEDFCTRNWMFPLTTPTPTPTLMPPTTVSSAGVTSGSLPVSATPPAPKAGVFGLKEVVGLVVALVVMVIAIVAIVMVVFVWFCCRRNKTNTMALNGMWEVGDCEPIITHGGLDPKTVTMLPTPVASGRGRFGSVYKGTSTDPHYPMDLAVKEFEQSGRESWLRECKMYELPLCHQHILSYYGKQESPKMRIITEFHAQGNLLCLLKDYSSVLDVDTCCNLELCILKGLNFLHTATASKPSVTHRDLKSSNILVRPGPSHRECCISDFGLAIALPVEGQKWEVVGTPRYMAPEIIDGSFHTSDILATDMYSNSIILWELLSRTNPDSNKPNSCIPPYCAPYSEYGLQSPTLPDMKIFFTADETKRPSIPIHFLRNSDPRCQMLVQGMKESWGDPMARLGAACFLSRLLEYMDDITDSGQGSSETGALAEDRPQSFVYDNNSFIHPETDPSRDDNHSFIHPEMDPSRETTI